ncbi:hypothetical protein cypCar_00001486, partial [Cyprinus carpio]
LKLIGSFLVQCHSNKKFYVGGDLIYLNSRSIPLRIIQDTLINMLQCFEFHESHIHSLKSRPHRLSENNERKSESESEDTPLSCTPPQFLKAKNMFTYSRINKYTVRLSDKKRDPLSKISERFIINAVEERVCDRQSNLSEVQTAEEKDLWPVDDSEPSQSSIDSNSTTSSFNTGSTEAESTCSFCEDQTGSEDGSPGRNMLDTPPSRSGILLKDPMLGAFPAAWKKRFPFSPMLLKTPVLPLRPPLREADSLTLNPSLLISPSQGLSRSLHPEGREALQTLFEDVWVTPESTVLKSPSLPGSFANESVGQILHLILCWNRSYPGIPSTTVTKELANLWHILPKKERRLYCLKAWSFSCQQNRNVRAQKQEAEMKADHFVPSPLHMLLAYRDKYAAVK